MNAYARKFEWVSSLYNVVPIIQHGYNFLSHQMACSFSLDINCGKHYLNNNHNRQTITASSISNTNFRQNVKNSGNAVQKFWLIGEIIFKVIDIFKNNHLFRIALQKVTALNIITVKLISLWLRSSYRWPFLINWKNWKSKSNSFIVYWLVWSKVSGHKLITLSCLNFLQTL